MKESRRLLHSFQNNECFLSRNVERVHTFFLYLNITLVVNAEPDRRFHTLLAVGAVRCGWKQKNWSIFLSTETQRVGSYLDTMSTTVQVLILPRQRDPPLQNFYNVGLKACKIFGGIFPDLEVYQIILLVLASFLVLLTSVFAFIECWYVYLNVASENRRNKLYFLITLFPVS